jgi:hypothetical protein
MFLKLNYDSLNYEDVLLKFSSYFNDPFIVITLHNTFFGLLKALYYNSLIMNDGHV